MPDDLPTISSNTSSPNSSPVAGCIGPRNPGPPVSNPPRSRLSSSSSLFFSAFQSSNPKGTSSAAFESMLTWLVAFYDAFNLYGRPEKLITDAAKSESMIFAMPSTMEDSYLNVEDVFMALAEQEQGDLENNTCSTREWRSKLKDLILTQLRQGKTVFNQAVLLNNAVAEVPVIRQPIPPHLRNKRDSPNVPIHTESVPAVRFSVNPEQSFSGISFPSSRTTSIKPSRRGFTKEIITVCA